MEYNTEEIWRDLREGRLKKGDPEYDPKTLHLYRCDPDGYRRYINQQYGEIPKDNIVRIHRETETVVVPCPRTTELIQVAEEPVVARLLNRNAVSNVEDAEPHYASGREENGTQESIHDPRVGLRRLDSSEGDCARRGIGRELLWVSCGWWIWQSAVFLRKYLGACSRKSISILHNEPYLSTAGAAERTDVPLRPTHGTGRAGKQVHLHLDTREEVDMPAGEYRHREVHKVEKTSEGSGDKPSLTTNRIFLGLALVAVLVVIILAVLWFYSSRPGIIPVSDPSAAQLKLHDGDVYHCDQRTGQVAPDSRFTCTWHVQKHN